MPTDNFDRANNDSMGVNWTEEAGDFDILSNRAVHTTGTPTYALVAWTGGGDRQILPTGAQVEIHPTSNVPATNAKKGLFILHSGTGFSNQYDAKHSTNAGWQIDVHKWLAGVKTRIGTIVQAATIPGLLRIEKAGTTITVKYNGASVATITDASHITGKSGLSGRNIGTDNNYDNFAVDDTGEPAPQEAKVTSRVSVTQRMA